VKNIYLLVASSWCSHLSLYDARKHKTEILTRSWGIAPLLLKCETRWRWALTNNRTMGEIQS